jgi:hypothetical protein
LQYIGKEWDEIESETWREKKRDIQNSGREGKKGRVKGY